MSADPAASTVPGAQPASHALRDWEAVRAATDIQYAPVQIPPQVANPPPEWLRWLGRMLQALFEPLGRWPGLGWPAFQKILIGLAVVLGLLVVWRATRWLIARSRRARPEAAGEPEWRPSADAARALLEEADRLAGEGRFDEAVHLLLRRSVDHIAEARPDWLHPAATAREIAGLPGLSDTARRAFATIAERVERSLFALRSLGEGDWAAARAAYADFARASLAAPGAPA